MPQCTLVLIDEYELPKGGGGGGRGGVPGPGVHEAAVLLACGLPSSSPPPWGHPTAPNPLSLLHSEPTMGAKHDTGAAVPFCCVT